RGTRDRRRRRLQQRQRRILRGLQEPEHLLRRLEWQVDPLLLELRHLLVHLGERRLRLRTQARESCRPCRLLLLILQRRDLVPLSRLRELIGEVPCRLILEPLLIPRVEHPPPCGPLPRGLERAPERLLIERLLLDRAHRLGRHLLTLRQRLVPGPLIALQGLQVLLDLLLVLAEELGGAGRDVLPECRALRLEGRQDILRRVDERRERRVPVEAGIETVVEPIRLPSPTEPEPV